MFELRTQVLIISWRGAPEAEAPPRWLTQKMHPLSYQGHKAKWGGHPELSVPGWPSHMTVGSRWQALGLQALSPIGVSTI